MRFRAPVLLLAMFLLCLLAPSAAPAAQEREFMKAYSLTIDHNDLSALSDAGVDAVETGFDTTKARTQTVVEGLYESQVEQLRADGIQVTPTELPKLAPKAQRETGGNSPNPYYDVYRTYMEPGGTYDEMVALAAAHPDIIKKEIVGTSLLGKPIIVLKMTENARNVADGTRPAVLYSAVNHAREWIAAEVGRRLPIWIAEHKDDDGIRRLLRTKELWFMPVQNPDGYDYTFTCGQGTANRPCGAGEASSNRFWRKTLRDNDGNGIFGDSQDGVDPNRNYPAKRGIDEEGASNNFGSQTYRGTQALSEPENLAFDRLLRKIDFKANVNYHSAAQLILTPVSNTTDYAPVDTTIFDSLTGTDGDSAVEPYVPERSSDLYESNGDTIDNGYLNYGVIGWTPELDQCQTAGGPLGCNQFAFPDDEGKVEAVFQKNLPMALNIANSLDKLDRPRNYDNDPSTFQVKPTHDIKVTRFDVSFGATQEVEATVRRSLGPVDLRATISGPGGPSTTAVLRMSEAPAGERYGEAPGVYYKRVRVTTPTNWAAAGQAARAAAPGDVIDAQVIAGGLRQRFSYRVAAVQEDASKKRVLVVAAEDYTGTSPNRQPGYDVAPRYQSLYVQSLEAAGYETAIYDVDKPPANAAGDPAIKYPTALGVLSHFDAVVYETGDDFLPQAAGEPNARHLPDPSSASAAGSQVMADWAHHSMLELRDYMNEGGKLVVAGRNVHQTYTAGDQFLNDPRNPSLTDTGPIQWAPDPVDFFFYPPGNAGDDDLVGTAFRRYRGISNDTWQNYLGAVGRQGGYGAATFDGAAVQPKADGLFAGLAPITVSAGSGNDVNQDANGISSPRAKSPTRLLNWSGISPQEPLRQERVELDVASPPSEQGGLALSTRDAVTFGFGLEQVDVGTRNALLARSLGYLLPTTADTTAPQVRFKFPADNTTATPLDPVEVDVTAYDERGDMKEVRLKADGRLVGTTPVFPFQFRYQPTQADVGKQVTLTAEAEDKAGNVATANLNVRVAAEDPDPEAPLPVNPPTLTGRPVVGETLTCVSGGFLNTPTSWRYEWLRNDVPVAGADRTTYTLTEDDLGRLMRCRITAINDAGEADATSDGLYVSAAAAGPGATTTLGAGGSARVAAPAGTRVSVSCKLVSRGRAVQCTVKPTGSAARGQRVKSTIRVAGTRGSATRSGRGSVRVTLRRSAAVKRSSKVVVAVTIGKQKGRMTVRLGRTVRTALSG